jgi:hypothetical protein
MVLRASVLVNSQCHDCYFLSNISLIASLNADLGIAPCAICGLPFIGMNSIEGILRIPNAAANSSSSSVSIL